jgi:hypothetical protein
MKYATDTYKQLADAVPHRHSVPHAGAQALLVLNYPPTGESSPMAHDPATGVCVSPTMRFLLGPTFMDTNAVHFKSKKVVLDAVAFEAPSSSSPYRTVSGLAHDTVFHGLRASCVVAQRESVAAASGQDPTDVPAFCAGAGAKLVGQQLELLHGTANLHYCDHPETAVPSPLFKGAVLPVVQQRERAVRNDAAWTVLKQAVHGSSSSGSGSAVTAYTKRAYKEPMTAEEYTAYRKGCVLGGVVAVLHLHNIISYQFYAAAVLFAARAVSLQC